jgi:predicted nucleic acid-binding protein
MNAVDTNILVYFLDEDEPVKRAKAVALLDRLRQDSIETILLWQAAAEFLSCLRRWENEGRITRQDTVRHLSTIQAMFRCIFPTRAVLGKSLDLSSRHSLSHWDSMLLAACIDAGVTTLYSEDLDDGAQYDSVRVVNPFA